MTHLRHGRKEPYTKIGVERLPCTRCGKKAQFQWNVCADGNLFRPLCGPCDVELNEMVLHWMGDPDAEQKVADYAKIRGIDR